jgi:FkbM family methyltransferase
MVEKIGFSVRRYHDPLQDISDLLAEDSRELILFDVGANTGQTARKLKKRLPSAEIFSFEPSPTTYRELSANVRTISKIHPMQMGLGDVPGKLQFNQNSNSDMSSFLELGSAGWGNINDVLEVEVDTVDHFCKSQRIDKIHLLKSDTQGFDLAVLKGAEQMLSAQKIDIIYMEINFAPLYVGAPSIKEIASWMDLFNYKIMSIYDLHYLNRVIGWADIMFLSPSFQNKMQKLK